MNFDIEMLNVGDADATIITYAPKNDEETVILIDAGRAGDGPKIVSHIKRWTKKKQIDLAICTHPDSDHIGGFPYIVNSLTIKEFWIHDPYKHIAHIKLLKQTAKIAESASAIRKGLDLMLESLGHAKELLELLKKKPEITLKEPFKDLTFDHAPLKVLWPSKEFYVRQLAKFKDLATLLTEERFTLQRDETSLLEVLADVRPETIVDKATDPSKPNASSAVLFFEPGKKRCLFTADATAAALANACKANNLEKLDWLSIPHHGSRYNISSKLIRHFSPRAAFVSASGKPGHPHDAVVELFQQVGTAVYSTEKGAKLYCHGKKLRESYVKAVPMEKKSM